GKRAEVFSTGCGPGQLLVETAGGCPVTVGPGLTGAGIGAGGSGILGGAALLGGLAGRYVGSCVTPGCDGAGGLGCMPGGVCMVVGVMLDIVAGRDGIGCM